MSKNMVQWYQLQTQVHALMCQFAHNKFRVEINDVFLTDPLAKLENLAGRAEHEGERSVYDPASHYIAAVRDAAQFMRSCGAV